MTLTFDESLKSCSYVRMKYVNMLWALWICVLEPNIVFSNNSTNSWQFYDILVDELNDDD